MKLATRTPIQRLVRLAELLRNSLPFTAGEFARELECCRKTVVRDLEFLRDRLGYEFTFDHHAQRYRLISAPRPRL